MNARVGPARRPALGWSDLAGSRVGLWGLGIEGAADLRRLRAMGVVPAVVADGPGDRAFGGLRVLDTGAGGLEALLRCDAVVKTPGISRYRPEARALVDAGVPLCGGLGLWMQEADRDRVCCVTGTKGKSTTTALCGHLLAGLGIRAMVAGNIGRPPWDPDAGAGWDLWVVETSSYQATDLASSPPVVAVTSLGPDHLDWHGGDVEAYYADKLSACAQPGARVTVADGSSPDLRSRAALLGPEVRWVDVGDPELDGPWVEGLGLPGSHFRRDALIARACLLALGVGAAADAAALARASPGFTRLDSRFRSLGTLAGVEFVDDSLSTTVLPALAALEALAGRPLAVLVGGQDRGVDYRPLGRALAGRRAPTLVLGLPDSGARILAAVRGALTGDAETGPAIAIAEVDDLTDATAAAFTWARPLGGVVLLSPAAPSFGRFRDYRARSAAFAEAMAHCADTVTAG